MPRKASLALVPVLALSACAITDYQLITDNDQVANGRGSGVVNTNGKAHFGKTLYAVSWPDGTDELFSMVDQKTNGDRTLTTYNNFSTSGEPTFHDDLYCNPDWQGCSIFTAEDPEIGDVDPFDGRLNPSCAGARSLMFMLAQTYRSFECGRGRLSLEDRLIWMNLGKVATSFGVEGLAYHLDRDNLTVSLDNGAGTVRTLAIHGSAELFVVPTRRASAWLDLEHPSLVRTGRDYADYLRHDATSEGTRVTVRYNGLEASWAIGGRRGPSTPERVLSLMRRRY